MVVICYRTYDERSQPNETSLSTFVSISLITTN
jgi:hypothetical protein